MNEKILAVRRKELPEHWLNSEVALSISWEHLLKQVSAISPCFIDRAEAESNYEFKQIIPYTLLADQEGRLATYRRKGTEKRLSGCLSLGTGGHLRRDDFSGGRFSWDQLSGRALRRELLEELPGLHFSGNPEFLGLINEEQTEVGHVHIGLVFVLRGIAAARVNAGEELGQLNWLPVPELTAMAGDGFELWSWLALQLFAVSGHPF